MLYSIEKLVIRLQFAFVLLSLPLTNYSCVSLGACFIHHIQKYKLNGKVRFEFNATIWQYSSPKGGWFFVSLPAKISAEIRENFQWQEEGWGRLKSTARINAAEWETAIWFDTKLKTYLLPLKAEIRKSNSLEIGQNVKVEIEL